LHRLLCYDPRHSLFSRFFSCKEKLFML
jgi:hypothetical protein